MKEEEFPISCARGVLAVDLDRAVATHDLPICAAGEDRGAETPVLDSYAMAAAMTEAGKDAVVSMLGLRSAAPPGFSESAVRTIVDAAERTGITRVLILSAFGVGDSVAKASWAARTMYKIGAKAIYADKAAGEAVLTASTLDWTLAYPVLLTNGPRRSRGDRSRRRDRPAWFAAGLPR